MNYLAHAYLSFGFEDILVGNMISDFVKGRSKFNYSPGIQKGIALHRWIDRFTDEHPATQEGKVFFRPAVGLYAGAFMDIVYDHFLARDAATWNNTALDDFSSGVYAVLTKHEEILPARLQQMLPYMKAQDWLYNYRLAGGIEKSFGGLVRRAAYLESAAPAYEAFIRNYEELQRIANSFIPDVKKIARTQLDQLLKD